MKAAALDVHDQEPEAGGTVDTRTTVAWVGGTGSAGRSAGVVVVNQFTQCAADVVTRTERG